jgi:putative transposase
VLRDYRAAGKFRLHAFVVMPDHFHFLITVGSQMTIERAMQLVKGGFAFRAGKELGLKSSYLAEGFFRSPGFDSEAFENQREYIHNNPVVARFAASAGSIFFFVGQQSVGVGTRPPARLQSDACSG